MRTLSRTDLLTKHWHSSFVDLESWTKEPRILERIAISYGYKGVDGVLDVWLTPSLNSSFLFTLHLHYTDTGERDTVQLRLHQNKQMKCGSVQS